MTSDRTNRSVHLQWSQERFTASTSKLLSVVSGHSKADPLIASALQSLVHSEGSATFESLAQQVESVIELYVRERNPCPTPALSKRQRIKDVVKGWIRASYPFVNIFLSVAKEGSSARFLVSPYWANNHRSRLEYACGDDGS
jgi:hypothetical protein